MLLLVLHRYGVCACKSKQFDLLKRKQSKYGLLGLLLAEQKFSKSVSKYCFTNTNPIETNS